MKIAILLMILAFGIGLIGGWALVSDPDQVSSKEDRNDSSLKRSKIHPNSSSNSSQNIEVLDSKKLREISTISNYSKRCESWRDYIQKLSLEALPKAYFEIQHEAMGLLDIEDPDATGLLSVSVEMLVEEFIQRGAENSLALMQVGLENNGLSELYESVFRKWGTKSPAQAAQFLEENKKNLTNQQDQMVQSMIQDLAKVWATKDPEECLTWISSLSQEEQTQALGSAVGMMHFENPFSAKKLFENYRQKFEGQGLPELIAYSMADSKPADALDWVRNLDPASAAKATTAIFEKWLTNDFETAAYAFNDLTGPLRDAAIPTIVDHITSENGEFDTAVTFLEAEADGPGRTNALINLMANWAYEAPEDAATWLREQKPGQSFDQASASLARELYLVDPEAGALWGNAIQDSSLRRERLHEAIEVWFKQNPSDAIHWIEHNDDLSIEDREHLTAKFPSFFSQ